MDEYTFEDLLAGGTVTCSYPGLETVRVGGVSDAESCESLFFPGCSFINYALPLVQSVYDLLVNAGQCDGISLLCCGKILEYEGDGGAARAAFEQQFRDHIAGTSIKRIVAACPNCVAALRKLLAQDEATAAIEERVDALVRPDEATEGYVAHVGGQSVFFEDKDKAVAYAKAEAGKIAQKQAESQGPETIHTDVTDKDIQQKIGWRWRYVETRVQAVARSGHLTLVPEEEKPAFEKNFD